MFHLSLFTCFIALSVSVGGTPPGWVETRRHYLSGTGPKDGVPWSFLCSSGRNSGVWTTIPVPSCWETQGFGVFDYGIVHRRASGSAKPPLADEVGHYRTEFETERRWDKSHIELVFDGVMTDAEITLNGQSVGPRHAGAFYRFSYNVTGLLRPTGVNVLEVTVSKVSSNRSVNAAERKGDFWLFGGIFRPVWLEIRPQIHIERVTVDARADGQFRAAVHFGEPAPPGSIIEATVFDDTGRVVGPSLARSVTTRAAKMEFEALFAETKAWTAEDPQLYTARFRLLPETSSSEPGHEFSVRFGFRTIELRPHDGLFVNGRKILLKGVNRHCFRPASGRTLSREDSYADVRLIKAMNMNAVRTAHYPPDEAFLEACDELGLYVLDELCGWHDSYDTPTGAGLIGEMVRRDVNHPSIILWNHGNERGWNPANDDEFGRWDPQGRSVLHPWANFGGIDTGHYPDYATLAQRLSGPDLYMPTEFLHGQYEGGSGGGLHDYWRLMQSSPKAVGGFLWAFADEGVSRPDHAGEIDTAGDLAADGIVGPHHERDGNFYAIRSLWSPLQISAPPDPEGNLLLTNYHDFSDLSTCSLRWTLQRFPKPGNSNAALQIIATGTSAAPAGSPHTTTQWRPALPADWRAAHALQLIATDSHGKVLDEWTWRLSETAIPLRASVGRPAALIERGEALAITWGHHRVEFDWATGRLRAIRKNGKPIGPRSGPRFVAYRQDGATLTPLNSTESLETLTAEELGDEMVVTARYRGNLRYVTWRIQPEQNRIRLNYEFHLSDEADLAGVHLEWPALSTVPRKWLGTGPAPVWRNRLAGGTYSIWSASDANVGGYWADWQWLHFSSIPHEITVRNLSGVPFFGVSRPSVRSPQTVPPPDLGLALLHLIPAIGTKFHPPSRLGPQSQPARLKGGQTGSVLFELPLE